MNVAYVDLPKVSAAEIPSKIFHKSERTPMSDYFQ